MYCSKVLLIYWVFSTWWHHAAHTTLSPTACQYKLVCLYLFVCLFVCLFSFVAERHSVAHDGGGCGVPICPWIQICVSQHKFVCASQNKFAFLNTNLNTNLRISKQIWIQICVPQHKFENKFAQISKQSSCHTVWESNMLKMPLNLVNHQIIIFLEFLPSDGWCPALRRSTKPSSGQRGNK